MTVINESQRTAARVLAIAFPVSFACVAVANFVLRGDLILDGDLAGTVQLVAEAEPTYRLSVLFDLLYAIGLIVLLSAEYVVLSPVGRFVALLASASKLVYAATAVLIALSSLAILRLATDPSFADGLGDGPLQALVGLNITGAWDQYYVGLVLWTLSSTLYAALWLKSRYIPRALAIFGVVTSAWCLFCAIAFLLSPGFATVVDVWLFDTPMAVYYLALSVWLLVKGPRAPRAAGSKE